MLNSPAHWKVRNYCRSAPERGFDPHPASMKLDECLYERETESGTGMLATPRVFELAKFAERAGNVLFSHANPGIFHAQNNSVLRVEPSDDLYDATCGRELDGIG